MTRIRWHVLMFLALFAAAIPLSFALDLLGVSEPARFFILIFVLMSVSMLLRIFFQKPPKGAKKPKTVDGGLSIPMYPPRADEAYETQMQEWRRSLETAKREEDEEAGK